MPGIFEKLNYSGQSAICVENAPESFQPAVEEMRGATTVQGSLTKGVAFALLFATKQAEVDRFAARFAKAASGDAVAWVAYPKGTSKNYRCDFNRDTGWAKWGELGFEPVRQVAIDQDWSALRFRRVEFIKKMTRSFAMTESGREKAKAGRSAPAKSV